MKRAIFFIIFIFVFLIVVLSILLPRANLNLQELKVYSALSFPTDHGAHPNFRTEWWYLNLLTRTIKTDGTDQKDLAYMLSFSRILGVKNLLSSRYDNTSKSFKESTDQDGSLVVQLMDGNRLFVQYGSSSNGLVGATLEELATGTDRKKIYHLTGRTVNMGSFDLTLKERTVVPTGFNTPLLWGGTTGNCQGNISVFSPDDTFYYSIPDLDITGTITDMDGVERNVATGKAWIDHQWFNSSPPNDWKGHYWTNFHFTDSGNLYNPDPHQALGFVTQIYTDGSKYTYWVKRNADGTNECGDDGTINVNSYGASGYPISWSLTLNKNSSQFIQTNGVNFSDNQIYQPPVGPKFVETASYYSGNINGTSFTGLGFFETHLTRPSPTSTATGLTVQPQTNASPSPSPSPSVSPSPTPSISPSPSPSTSTCTQTFSVGPSCNNLSGSTNLSLNTQATFSCSKDFSSLTAIAVFRALVNNQEVNKSDGVAFNNQNVVDWLININQAGDWLIQCRVCTDNTQTACTEWGKQY